MSSVSPVPIDAPSTPRAELHVFSGHKSPAPAKLEEGDGNALRSGGAYDLYSRKNIGLLAQYAAVGVIRGTLVNSVYAFLFQYIRMSGVEVASARALSQLIWTLKFFVGIVTDCVPIAGYHRRPYIVLGWLIVFAMLFTIAVLPLPDPYYPNAKWAKYKSFTPEQEARLNRDAPAQGVTYLVLMVMANVGMLIAVTATDGVLVDFAQREPESIRGTTQTMVEVVKFSFAIISACLTGFGMNGPEYGGSFGSSMGFNAVMGICSVFALAVLPFSWFCIQEERVEVTPTLRQIASKIRHDLVSLYELLQLRVVYQIVAYRFLRNLFGGFSSTATSPVQSLWAGVEPLNDSIAHIGTYIVACSGIYLVKRVGLQWNWRLVVVTTQFMVVALDAIPTMLTIWNVHRSQWLWLGVPLIEDFPRYVGAVITSFAMVEIVEKGNEAAVFGLVSTVSNLAAPFATVIYKNVDAMFDVTPRDLVKDTHHVRSHVMYTFLIAYGVNLVSVVFVFLLPRQKAETQAMKNSGQRSRLMGIVTVVYLTFAFCWTFMTNAMSFSSKTSCLRIAGGTGCDKKPALVERVAADASFPLVFSAAFITATLVSAATINTDGIALDFSVLALALTVTLIFAVWGGAFLATAAWAALAARGNSTNTIKFAQSQITAIVALSLIVAIIQFRWQRRHRRNEPLCMATLFAFCFPCCSMVRIAAQTRANATPTADTLPAYSSL
ncbi:hypothetical protein ATCC90586_002809 [Pythium insidiosum]|nr:hypothetical protein ATCC90586_002809 [Pythium insidiosum]